MNSHTNSETKPVREKSLWVRALYMLVFLLAFGISESVLYLLTIIGELWPLAWAVCSANHRLPEF